MWSDRYIYYYIQSDELSCQKLKKSTVIDAILETNLFVLANQQFINTKDFPWITMVLVEDNRNLFVTRIDIVGAKGENINQQIYVEPLKQIAKRLQWKLYLEEDDDGNEDIEL